MKVIITGASGFIGHHVVRQCLNLGEEVVCQIRPNENVLPASAQVAGTELEDLTVDVLRGADSLIHLAAMTDTTCEDGDRMLDVNCHQAGDLVRRAVEAGIPNVVVASSAAVYGDAPCPFVEDQDFSPANCYAWSKARMEAEMCAITTANPTTKIVCLRFSNVWGTGEGHKGKSASMMFRLCQQMKAGKRPQLYKHGNQYRDWVHVNDVVDACLLARRSSCSDVFNIGSGEATTFNSLVAFWRHVLKVKLRPEYIDNPNEGAYQSATQMDISKAQRCLEWKPKMSCKAEMERLARTC